MKHGFSKALDKLKRQLAEAEAALEARKKPPEETGPRVAGEGLVIDEWVRHINQVFLFLSFWFSLYWNFMFSFHFISFTFQVLISFYLIRIHFFLCVERKKRKIPGQAAG